MQFSQINENNSHLKEILIIFSILLFFSSLITVIHYIEWENSSEREQHKILALLSGDEPWYLEMSSTIFRHGSISPDAFYKDPDIDTRLVFPDLYYEVDSCRLHQSLLAADGHCYSGHQPGLSILLIPGYVLGGVVGAMLTINVLFSVQGILIFKFTQRYCTVKISFISSIVFSLTTILLSFSTEIYPDLVAGFFLLLLLYIFFLKKPSIKNSLYIGFILGFFIFLKSGFIIFPIVLIPILIGINLKNNQKKFAVIIPLVFIGFFFIYLIYGSVSAPIEKYPGFGGGNAHWFIQSISQDFEKIFSRTTQGLANLLFGSSYGLFVFSPLFLLSIFGLKYLWKNSPQLTITIIVTAILFILTHSFLIGYAASWTLPSRYLIPIVPMLSIPFALLLHRFHKNIIFHSLLAFSVYVGIFTNILLARILYGHPTPQMRFDIANQVYFGIVKIFPYVDVTDPSTITNFWNSSGPYFWIFLVIFCTLFIIHICWFKIKNFTQLNRKNKIILIIVTGLIIGILIFVAYEPVNSYQIEFQISNLYNDILYRDPNPEGLTYWKNQILNEGKSIEWVKEQLNSSVEGTITIQISNLYNDILYRDPDPKGLTYWKNQILNEGKSIEWVKEQFIISEELLKINE